MAVLYITGAFYNLNWKALITDMTNLGCSQGIVVITRSYLTGRTAQLIQGGVTCKVNLTKGCSQGSLFGPVL